MSRGRPRKPVNIKKLEGTFRRDRDANKDLIDFGHVINAGEPPAYFNEFQKKEFEYITSVLIRNNILQTTDINLVISYCIEANNYFKMEKKLRDNGITALSKGKIILRPEAKFMNDSFNRMIKITEKLGLSPVDRMKLTNINKVPVGKDPLAGEL